MFVDIDSRTVAMEVESAKECESAGRGLGEVVWQEGGANQIMLINAVARAPTCHMHVLLHMLPPCLT